MAKLNSAKGPKSKTPETKFLNINNFEARGPQIWIYPNYSERDLTKEKYIEFYAINLEMLAHSSTIYREAQKNNKDFDGTITVR